MGLLLMWHELHDGSSTDVTCGAHSLVIDLYGGPYELNVSVGFFFDVLDDLMEYMGLGPYVILIRLVYSKSSTRRLDVLINSPGVERIHPCRMWHQGKTPKLL